jgi:peroxiredoxin Q/BCP
VKHAYLLWLLLSLVLAACGGAQTHTDRSRLLAVGSEVPNLVRVDQNGTVINLRGGPPTLIYFYPKDGTPGCTKEACGFRDVWAKYAGSGLRVLGVSIDTDERHREFAKEHELPFSLIADPEHVWSDAFGVGRFLGTVDERVSFLVDSGGLIRKVYADVDPGVHAAQVLDDARALGVSVSK